MARIVVWIAWKSLEQAAKCLGRRPTDSKEGERLEISGEYLGLGWRR